MAGRHHIPSHAIKLREVPLPRAHHPHPHPHPHPALIEDPRLTIPRPHPAALIDDRISAQNRDIQTLLHDNQRLAATHVALKQELSVAQQELRHLTAAAATVKAERDAQVRDVYDKSLKFEAEARAIDAMNVELAQVRADVQKLDASRKELMAQLKAMEGDVVRSRADSQKLPAIKMEIETMYKELQRGRAAVEFEKKTHANNLEQSHAMEKNMASMARELEKLSAELANAEARARAAAAAAAAANPSTGYATNYGNPDMGYGVSSYADPYGIHQIHGGGGGGGGGADAGSLYGSGAVPHAPYDMQRSHLLR